MHGELLRSRPNNLATGASYLVEGAQLLMMKKFRAFIIIPILINILIFLGTTTFMISLFSSLMDYLMGFIPSWEWFSFIADILAVILWVLLAVLLAIVYGYSFSILTNLIAAPFYGILAEKIEHHLTGKSPPTEALPAMIVRTIGRELTKIWYFLVRAILIFLLSFVPLIGLVVPVIALAWGAWSMSIQYSDYAADNHQLPFKSLRKSLWTQKFTAGGFGGLIMLGAMIPVVNIFVMPAAVAGGTIMWVRDLKQKAHQI
ncbi:sulfate transporter CysZ [Marinibactrum halimedae]|uniref:Sulfate transporter CysZ n=1 Tax=Marinibactrum halimedae TaxID=1444977 RepID=A0AA37T4Z8_9GAMM|nr:sulfate transporter CysZ [Marinibactrum halimedae]MCD9458088.1 sulfate transporter CysZ [Marinibactrum halimedae]GLS25022.1 sulfate transporter CysZ [Marinibactrum halimedae]